MKKSFTPDFRPDDEAQAFSLNHGAYYFSIQVCDSGFDYTIYRADYTEFDGGQLDEPTMTMPEAIDAILEDFQMDELPRERCDYDTLLEEVYEADLRRLPSLKAKIQQAAEQQKLGTHSESSVDRSPER